MCGGGGGGGGQGKRIKHDSIRLSDHAIITFFLYRALPLILDSDEEVMTTKFEISKMN